jgi:HAD superfamily hydrolase (TIGR01490 family)
MTWKQRQHEDDFETYERTTVEAYNKSLARLSKETLLHAVEKVFQQYKDQTYTYTRDLIQQLKAQNYLLFAISGSHVEVIEILAQYYGFDDFGGTKYLYKDGKYTGDSIVLRREEKPKYLAQLVAKHHVTYAGSVGIGDTDSDIPMLSAVERPIAFNPNKRLFEHARAHTWPIVVERKNMIYQMEHQHGTYILAQTEQE